MKHRFRLRLSLLLTVERAFQDCIPLPSLSPRWRENYPRVTRGGGGGRGTRKKSQRGDLPPRASFTTEIRASPRLAAAARDSTIRRRRRRRRRRKTREYSRDRTIATPRQRQFANAMPATHNRCFTRTRVLPRENILLFQ